MPENSTNQTPAEEPTLPGRMQQACSVSSTRREVIDNKLLDALSDDEKVAAILTRNDLDILIESLGWGAHMGIPGAGDMQRDLQQLRAAAFPQNAEASDRHQKT